MIGRVNETDALTCLIAQRVCLCCLQDVSNNMVTMKDVNQATGIPHCNSQKKLHGTCRTWAIAIKRNPSEAVS